MASVSLEIHLKNAFALFKYQVRQVPAELWRDDAAFVAAWERARPRTLMDPTSAFMLHQLARRAAKVPGDAAELGVYKGGTALLIARALPGKTLHLFDTFAGLPAPGPRDRHERGHFAAPEAEVRAFLKDEPGLAFRPGEFPATARELDGTRFAFVHVDADLEKSTRDALEFFWPRLSPGGAILIDDYGLSTCPGVRAAVDAFQKGRPERPLVLPAGQCLLEKPA